MNTSARPSAGRNAPAAGLLLAVGLILLMAPPTSAQLGSLVVNITAPAAGSTVTGTIPVNAQVTLIGMITVSQVQFKLDDVDLGAPDTSSPYSISWNTRTASNGSHTLTAVARDGFGVNWTSQPVNVTVFNDLTPPAVAITSPAAGASLRGSITVAANASDNVGVSGVQFRLDGVNLGAEDTTAPYSMPWETTTSANGAHTVTAVARDAAGNTTTSTTVNVTVDNSPPTVGITSPAAGSSVAGSITVAADATDNIAVAGVQFFLDGTPLGAEDLVPPYQAAWSTATASNGSHTLSAVARDVAGNVTTSASVALTVDNAAPTVSITAPAPGATLSQSITIAANAADNAGVVGVQFFVDGAPIGAEDVTAPYESSWNTTTATDGAHTVTASARDAAGNITTSSGVGITVDNGPPAINITSPANGSTVAASISVTANATDTVGVAGVQFFVDGVALGAEKTVAPYSVDWNTTTASEGSHTLTARARDGAGNTTTSAAVAVTVANNTPSVTRIEDSSTAIAFTPAGSWLEGYSDARPWSGGTTALGFNAGQRATLNFTGTAVSWIGFRGPQTGIANVHLDGALVATIDAYSPSETNGTVMYTTSGLVNGPHTIAIEVLRMKHESSTDYFVAVDAFDVASTGGGPPVDTTPPTVSIASPANGATVSGMTTITANAADAVGVVGVRFFDGALQIGAEDTTAPYEAAWNTSAAANGEHTLTAIARDAAGNATTSAPVTVTVANSGGAGEVTRVEETSAAITYTGTWAHNNASRPWSGGTASIAALTGTVATATFTFTGMGVSWIGFRAPFAGIANVYLDGTQVAIIDAYAATEQVQAVMFSASGLPNTTHTIVVESTGTKNASSSDSFVVVDAFDVTATVVPDTEAPTVSITWPTAGAAVSNKTPVSAVAGDNKAVAGVRFLVDGVQVGAEDTAAPYSIVWDSTTAADGARTVTAVARDAAGNTTTSAPVTVNVSNAAPSPAPATTRIDDTDLRIKYTAGIPAPGQPENWFHGSRSRDWSNGTASFNRSKNSRASITFNGTAISWVGFRGYWTGIAHVYLDDVFVAEVDLFLPICTAEQRAQGCIDEDDQVPVFTATGLPAGQHTLVVEVTGGRNAGATDNAVVVDGFDIAPASPPPAIGTRVEETAAAVTYTGTWTAGDTSSAWSGGTAAVSATAGARASVIVTGTEIRWIGRRGPQAGIARVFLDGAFQAEVDLHYPTAAQGISYIATSLAPGSHTLTVEVTGLKNAASTGTAVAVDAFDVRSRFEERDAAAVYTGTWQQEYMDRPWSGSAPNTGGGTAARSSTAGARVEFTFTGTQVQWISSLGPAAGMADVSIDGTVVERIDLYAAAETFRVPVFTSAILGPGPHTLRIDVTGLKNGSATNAIVAIDAFDVALPSPGPVITRIQQTDASVVYENPSSAWSMSSANKYFSGRTVAMATTAGARATFTFTGTHVRWIGQRRRDSGIARVYIDGVLIGNVDTFTPTQDEFQAAVFGAAGLSPGTHTLTIEVTGTKQGGDSCAPGPPACSGGYMIIIDAFEIY